MAIKNRQPQLNLGQIDYLNCWPLYHQLDKKSVNNFFNLHPGHPAQLNKELENGTIDISPSSSILPAVSPINDYFVMPGIAIASLRQVCSVILLSRRPLSQLEHCNITLTNHSLTSIFLLQIILFRFYQLKPESITFTSKELSLEQKGEATLVIGDQALELYHNRPEGFIIYDLGLLWHQFTGLPFVYALWIGRQESLKNKSRAVLDLHQNITEIIAKLPESLAEMAISALAEKGPSTTLNTSQLLNYWRQAISYKLDQTALAGLHLFYRYAHELGLTDRVPELDFFPRSDTFR